MSIRAARTAGFLLGALALAACAAAAPRNSDDVVAPAMIIERFLRAANQNDLDTMARLFGTQAGPVTRTWTRKEVDDRMFIFASLLRHSDFTVLREQIVPGRRGEASQYIVRLVVAQGPVEVPFTMVRTRDQHWIIEQIGIESITHPGRPPAKGTRS
jgi:hypothetical protein